MTCERKGKWFGACNFEPRYDHEPPKRLRFDYDELVFSEEAADIIKQYTKRTYVHEICTTCGKIIERES